MRLFIFFVFFSFLFAAFASDDDLGGDIWINGNSEFRSHKTHDRTIYFSSWNETVDDLREEEGYFLALQLDDRFDPLPYDAIELPDLTALASVPSDETIAEYLTFLEHYARTMGFSYLVLPDTAGYSIYEREVIEEAQAKAPHFFVQKTLITHQVPESKKEYRTHSSSHPQIIVAPQDENFKKLSKWYSKYSQEEARGFFQHLEASKTQEYPSTYDLPESLQDQLVRSGIYAVDPYHQFPVLRPQITYLGTNEKLIYWLSKYAEVHTSRQSGMITVVDHLSNEFTPIQSGDVVLTLEKLEATHVSQLVFPISADNQEVLIAKMLFGSADIYGRNESSRYVPNQHYLSFSEPLTEGVDPKFQDKIDSIGLYAISKYATPGLQLAVLKNGSLIHQQAMGYYTYDSIKPVKRETLYDLASLTKVMATLPAVALLIDRDQLHLEDSISQYLPEYGGSNKAGITIKQLLAHNAGLKSYIPFWSMMMEGDRLDAFYYKTPEDEANDVRTYGYEPDPIMLDTLRGFIVSSDLSRNPDRYRYSDIGFMILHQVVERITGQPFDQFLTAEFYQPMGLTNTSFNPIQNGVDVMSIAPTEYDQRFRNSLVWGEVHDRNAAVFGGVSGHAGLFSNAKDLAKMMSMYLNGGEFGGRRYLSEEVLNTFNSRLFRNNRRGLGWDKKGGKYNIASSFASDESFGHTGFTGTMVWADPKEDLIFVFLSNRIYPDASNQRISEYDIRKNMHDSLYEAINLPRQMKLN